MVQFQNKSETKEEGEILEAGNDASTFQGNSHCDSMFLFMNS